MSRLPELTLTVPGMRAHIGSHASGSHFLAWMPASPGFQFPLRTPR